MSCALFRRLRFRRLRFRRLGFGRGSLALLAGLALAGCEHEREIVTQVEALKPLAQAPVASPGLTADVFTRDEVPERPPITACSDVEKKARELAAALPRQLDADTRATRVSATGCDLRLEYELVTLDASDVSERGMRAMRHQVLDRLCSDKGALAVMQRGGRFTNVYYDRVQAPIALFTVSADDCGI
jgi:hypothetical protein